MANYKPVIPRADRAFDVMQKNLITQTSNNRVAWGIPDDEITALQTRQALWANAWAAAKERSTRTSVQVTAKNLTRTGYEASLRPFIQRWVTMNPMMSNADRVKAGISPRVKVKSKTKAPDSVPILLHRLKQVTAPKSPSRRSPVKMAAADAANRWV